MGWWSRLRTWAARQVIQELEGSRKNAPVPAGYFQGSGLSVLNWQRGIEHDHDYSAFAKTFGDSHPYLFACVDLRASSLASLPLRIWQRTGDEPREVTRGPVVDLLRGVNPQSTWRDLIYSTSVDYDLNGNAYWWCNPDPSGRFPAAELWRLQADQVYIKPGGAWVESYIVGRGEKAIVKPAEQVVHFRFPHPFNDLYGLSRLLSVALTADSDKKARESDLDLLKHGLTYDALLKVPGSRSDEQLAALQERINARWQGSKHGILPVDLETDLVERQSARRDMEFAVMREMNREEICAAFGVPPPMVHILTRATYSNMEQAEQQFWGTTMQAHAAAIQSTITEFLLPRFDSTYYAEFDFSSVAALEEDKLAERVQDWAETQAGGRTINEFRQKWEPDLPKLDWGDEGYMPMSQMPVGALVEAATAPKEPLPPEAPPPVEPPPAEPAKSLALPEVGGGESHPFPARA